MVGVETVGVETSGRPRNPVFVNGPRGMKPPSSAVYADTEHTLSIIPKRDIASYHFSDYGAATIVARGGD